MKKTGKPEADLAPSKQRLSENELRQLFENMISPFSYYRMIYDEYGRARDYVFLAVNLAFERETGLSREDIIGKSVLSVFPQTEAYWIEAFGRVGKTGVPEEISNFSSALGKWYSIRAYSPKPAHVAITVSDITDYIDKRNSLEKTALQLKDQQQENYRLAHVEPITGLPNRACLYETFAQKMNNESSAHFSVAVFAPDNLAEILASYGSVLSDKIMRMLAERVCGMLTAPTECFSMTGTDMVMLYSHPCEEQQMRELLDRIHKAIRQAVECDGVQYYITASCGVACYPRDGTDRDELIMKANLALYQAKRAGESVVFFSDRIGEKLVRRTRIRNALPKALENKEFSLHFQPQMQSFSERILGFEALLRWNSPELGEVPPLEFISIAEESRLIQPLGTWVLKQACRTLKKLNEQFRANYFMAINVSGAQLYAEDFVEQVLAVLAETSVSPGLLELEVTESVLVNRELRAMEKLNSLYACGVHIALDDFGTGFSSLSLLKDLKISTLKIDKSFIQAPEAAALAETIVQLGHMLGTDIVAEGVETEEQLKKIRLFGCERVQGFYYARPMPLSALEAYIKEKEAR